MSLQSVTGPAAAACPVPHHSLAAEQLAALTHTPCSPVSVLQAAVDVIRQPASLARPTLLTALQQYRTLVVGVCDHNRTRANGDHGKRGLGKEGLGEF